MKALVDAETVIPLTMAALSITALKLENSYT